MEKVLSALFVSTVFLMAFNLALFAYRQIEKIAEEYITRELVEGIKKKLEEHDWK